MSDTFRNGGDLVDIDRWFAGRDKVQHLVCGAALLLLLRRWTTLDALGVIGVVVLLALAWELFEFARYKAGKTLFSDKPSWRDIVAGVAGALLALFIF